MTPALRKTAHLFLLFYFSITCSLYAQKGLSSLCPKPQRSFQQILDPLSQSNVKTIVQDAYGFIWMGTEGGLNRYDGQEMQIYESNPDSPGSLSDDRINDLLIDSRQRLWIASYKHLMHYDYEQEQFEVIPNPEKVNALDALVLLEDQQQQLWIGTLHGIYIYDQKEKKIRRPKLANPSLLKGQHILALREDASGRIWLGTQKGIFQISKNRQEVIDPNLLKNTKVNELLIDQQEILWAGTEAQGLYACREKKNNQFEIKQFQPDLQNPYALGGYKIQTLLQDRQKRIWVGTEKAGLHLYCPEKDGFISYQKNLADEQALKSNSIWEIFEDRAGRLWLGSNNQGAFVHDPYLSKFNFTDKGDKNNIRLKFSLVTNFLELGNKIWIATDGGGITEWDRNRHSYRFINHNPYDSNSIGSDEVICLFQDSEGIIWTGNWEGGLNRFNPSDSTFRTYKHQKGNPNSIGSNSIFSIKEDQNGDLWMSTWGQGITRFRKSDHSFFNIPFVQYDPDFISSPHTYDVEIDDLNGDIWLGSVLGVEVIRMINDQEYHIRHIKPDKNSPYHLSSAFVQCIFEDSQNRIWIGTDNGLNLYHRENKTFEKFYPKDGLPGKVVKDIIEDDEGDFWLSTNQGLAHLVQKNGQWIFSKYDKSDGLQGKEFFFNASYKTKAGEIFFGGVNGFNYFFPENIQDNPLPPQTQLLGFKLFNKRMQINKKNSPLSKSILLSDEIVLNHQQFVFSIDYQGVYFTQNDKNQYAYKLEGFEKEWNYVGHQRSATYTNLDPGTYIFMVKSASHHGVWSEKIRRLKIRILPAWWNTWWARSLFYMSIICLPLVIFWIRYSVIQKQKNILEKEVEKRTTEVINQKNELIRQATELGNLNHQKNKLFSIISHDLRSPLSTLLGISRLLEADMLEKKDLLVIKEEISRRVEGISIVVDDLLLWAKGQMDGEVTQAEYLHMFSLGEEMIQLYEDKAQQKEVKLESKVCPDTRIYADKNQVRVILRNLFSNALKYTKKGDRVALVQVKIEQGFVTYMLEDTGIGLAPQKAQRLFSGQTNIISSGTSGEQGFGLGLQLVKEYIEKNRGQIWVESAPNKGSRFYFSLPESPIHPK